MKLTQYQNRNIWIKSSENGFMKTKVMTCTIKELLTLYKEKMIKLDTDVQRPKEISKKKQQALIRNILLGFNIGALQLLETEEADDDELVPMLSIDGNQRIHTLIDFFLDEENPLELTPLNDTEDLYDELIRIDPNIVKVQGNKDNLYYEKTQNEKTKQIVCTDMVVKALENFEIECIITKYQKDEEEDDYVAFTELNSMVETYLFCSYNLGTTNLTKGDLLWAKEHDKPLVQFVYKELTPNLIKKANQNQADVMFKKKKDMVQIRKMAYFIFSEIAISYMYAVNGTIKVLNNIPSYENGSFSAGDEAVHYFFRNGFNGKKCFAFKRPVKKQNTTEVIPENKLKTILTSVYDDMYTLTLRMSFYLGESDIKNPKYQLAYCNLYDIKEEKIIDNIKKSKCNAALHAGIFTMVLKNKIQGKRLMTKYQDWYTNSMITLRRRHDFATLIGMSTKTANTVLKKLKMLELIIDKMYVIQDTTISEKLKQAVINKYTDKDGFLRDAFGEIIYPNEKFHIDHIVPLAQEGKTELANLQILRAHDNRAKGITDNTCFLQYTQNNISYYLPNGYEEVDEFLKTYSD